MQDVKIGDIFYSSWGYDQTNITYYQVISRTKSFANLREIEGKTVDGDGWRGKVIPVKDRFKGETIRRKICDGYDGTVIFKIESYEYARPWDGKPQNYTSYA